MQSGTQEKPLADPAVASRQTWYIIRFLISWIASLVVVLAITLLNDINWTRPILERKLGELLNRDVELGKIAWGVGSNGVTIETKKLVIKDPSGETFLTSGQSEVGVSVLALLRRKLVITFIEADHANLRFVKTGPYSWNFDDLLQTGPEIRLLQLTSSRIGIYDESNAVMAKRLAPMQLEKVELKLNFPHKNRKRPFFLSFSLPSKGYSTTFTLDGLGVGELGKWKDNQYTFKADAQKVNPRDLQRLMQFVSVPIPSKTETKTAAATGKASEDPKKDPVETAIATSRGLIDLLAPVRGSFDFDIKGEGTFEKGIKAKLDTKADGLQIDHPTIGQINAGKALGSLSANINQDLFSWKDLVLKMRGIKLQSSGSLEEWQANEPKISADLKGEVPDLGVLQDLIKAKTTVPAPKRGLTGLAETLKPARLTGHAELEIKIDGTTNNTILSTQLKTHDLAIKEVLTRAHEKFPILCAIGLSNQARIETDLKLENSDRIEIVNGKLIGPGTNLNASGWLDLKSDRGQFKITGDKIALANTAVGISTNDGAYKQVLGCIKLPGKNSFSLGGTVSANADLKTDGDRYSLDGKIHLNDATFALKDNSLKMNKVAGNVYVVQNNNSGTMTLSGITGQMGEGNFQLDGKMVLTHTPVVDLTLHATRFDLKHLSSLMKLFQIQQMDVITERQLYGRVKDVVLKVTGTAYNPKVFFSAVPDDLYYAPPGLTRPLRAKAGVIVYDNDQLILREVAIITNNKTITTSCTIDHVSKECILSRVKTKTDNIELADIHYYLSSTAMPPPLRKAYLDFLAQYKITGMHGRAYGDILCLIGKKNDVTFDGLIGLYKAGATISGYPLTKLEGIFAASGDQLLLQDLSGYIRGSKFSLDGYIDKYRSNAPSWRCEVAANLAPRELIEMIPHLTDELNTAKFEIKSKGALSLRAKVAGDFNANRIQYSLVADEKDRMVIEGSFGKIYQPTDMPLTIDGIISLDKTKIDIGDTHVLVGETLLSLNGEMLFPEPELIKAAEAGTIEKPLPEIKVTFKIPPKSPVKVLVAMVDPPLAKEIRGTIGGYITIDGDLHNPRLLSDFAVNDIDAKSLNISGLNGRLRSGGAPAVAGDRREEETESILEVDSVKVRHLPVTRLKAHVALVPSESEDGKAQGPVVQIEKGEAHLADGLMKFQARYNPGASAIWAKASFEDISTSRIGDELMGRPDEIKGTGHAELEFETKGEEYKNLVKNLKGHGKIEIEDGVIAKFSDLETKLTQYNLLTQGIFGFNFNNLLQSMWPVRTGEFNSVTNSFSFNNGLLKVEELRFDGKDMRIWGSGTASLETNKVQLDMAGKIPRVQGSMLGGSLGTASRNLTLQKLMKVVTFGRLESLPALPVLGAIATDKPRTFMFSVDSSLDNPKLILRSIEKSFKWLPNKPEATAHPVPGLVTPM